MKIRFKFSIAQLLGLMVLTALIVRWLFPGLPYDRDLAGQVPLVLRVQAVQRNGGSKYHWTTVKVLGVVKNSTGAKIPESLNIASIGWGEGLPTGECTVYLVRYNVSFPKYGWKLHKPDATGLGYSHHAG